MGQKNSRNLSGGKNHAISRDKKITHPLGTKKNQATSQDKNHANSQDKKNHETYQDKKKVIQPLGTKKITQPPLNFCQDILSLSQFTCIDFTQATKNLHDHGIGCTVVPFPPLVWDIFLATSIKGVSLPLMVSQLVHS